MDSKNFRPLLLRWQVHVKYLIQAPFAEEFGRQLGNVIGRGDDEHRRALFRKPGQKGAKYTGRSSAICDSGTLRADKCFVDLIHPQDRWGDGFGDSNGTAHVLL